MDHASCRQPFDYFVAAIFRSFCTPAGKASISIVCHADTCPTNFSTNTTGFAQLVSLHTAATVTLKMTEPGVVVFTSSGAGQCASGVLVNIVVSSGMTRATTLCKDHADNVCACHMGAECVLCPESCCALSCINWGL